jgi:hypothetical protein
MADEFYNAKKALFARITKAVAQWPKPAAWVYVCNL